MKKLLLIFLAGFIVSCSSTNEDKLDITGTYKYRKSGVSSINPLESIKDDGSMDADSAMRSLSIDVILDKMQLTIILNDDSLYFENSADGRFAAMNYKLVNESELIYTTADGQNRQAILTDSTLTVKMDIDKNNVRDVVFYKSDGGTKN